MSDKEAREARKAAITQDRDDCNAATGLRCDVVTLYQGGELPPLPYKKYTDVRLVFAPEQQIAFFGGDPDNFSVPAPRPRHLPDRPGLRERPAREAPAYLPFSTSGVKDGDLVFVSGNPGSTSRLDTQAQLELTRDVGCRSTPRAHQASAGGAARVLGARPRAGAPSQGADLRPREQPQGARRPAARAAGPEGDGGQGRCRERAAGGVAADPALTRRAATRGPRSRRRRRRPLRGSRRSSWSASAARGCSPSPARSCATSWR